MSGVSKQNLTKDGKIVLRNKETGKTVLAWPADAREILTFGEHEVVDQEPGSAVAPKAAEEPADPQSDEVKSGSEDTDLSDNVSTQKTAVTAASDDEYDIPATAPKHG
jgi:hypothetical protein